MSCHPYMLLKLFCTCSLFVIKTVPVYRTHSYVTLRAHAVVCAAILKPQLRCFLHHAVFIATTKGIVFSFDDAVAIPHAIELLA